MESRGLRSLLQPTLYAGIAILVHGMLFLIPLGGGANRPENLTTRGVRVRAYIDSPPARQGASPSPVSSSALPTPPASTEKPYSVIGAGQQSSGIGLKPTVEGSPGSPTGGTTVSPGSSNGTGTINREGALTQSEYGRYLERLRSEGVQGWSKDSARVMRQGWKGSGTGTGRWGTGTGSGTGGGKGMGSGGLGGGTGGSGYLDPRVRMVVVRYPVDSNNNAVVNHGVNIETRYRQVPYPDLKFKKKEFVSGWWNVYINLRTDGRGAVTSLEVLQPDTDGELERQFVSNVRKEIAKWSFEPMKSEIIVDVRFYVE